MEISDQWVTVMLPSLIHRIGSDTIKRLKPQAQSLGCELKRIRRSRNWQLVGEAISVQHFVTQIKPTEYQDAEYLIRKLEMAMKQHSDKLEPLEVKLQRLITQNPSITLAELMVATQCSLVQARSARFAQDNWD
ncbi:ribosome recycling factor family protein [Vibrio tarriae]|uniref:Ribosome recycling factor n=1 Tax=Vibrio tarriae TaxID=2014742 RepID=A0AAU8WU05_9VIBR|nr:ribosome recycling factor family protein [Vibrio tarriae]ASK55265.1 ribosome recycling factor [Vibrio tarriae]RBM27311.1 ribosome recycling factor [Vibrio tarriae]RBM37317.1 ribosome recycling factor [Vibrio tarriae]RBM56213.1 ribosome recycling factor [Vibrio tarriae]